MSNSRKPASRKSELEQKILLLKERILDECLSENEREEIYQHLLECVRKITEKFIEELNYKTRGLLYPYKRPSEHRRVDDWYDPLDWAADPESAISSPVQSLKSLEDQIKNEKYLWKSSIDSEILSISDYLTSAFISGDCRCNDTRKKNSGQKCARKDSHSLRAWLEKDTGKTLEKFLSGALKGYYGKRMLIKEIQYGMAYIRLFEEGLRFTENKIMNRCLNCRDQNDEPLRYEGHYCYNCSTAFNERTMKRSLSEHFITERAYDHGEFWQCKGNACGNVFPVRKGKDNDICPYEGCGYRPAGRAKVTKAYYREIFADEPSKPEMPLERPGLDLERCCQFSRQYIFLTDLIFMAVTGELSLTIDEWLEQKRRAIRIELDDEERFMRKKESIRELFRRFLIDDCDPGFDINDIRAILRKKYIAAFREGMPLTDIHLTSLNIGDIRNFLKREVES
ncbi:MAG: hypothetical protein AB2L14_23425 [Candidatus Xenobiia bacterium LiM19]